MTIGETAKLTKRGCCHEIMKQTLRLYRLMNRDNNNNFTPAAV